MKRQLKLFIVKNMMENKEVGKEVKALHIHLNLGSFNVLE